MMLRRCLILVLLLASVSSGPRPLNAQENASVAWSIGYDPATLDPAKVDDSAAEMVRYLTGGVLLRINRHTGTVEPALASAWDVSPDGRIVTLHLRRNLSFSDGSPLTSADVAWSLRRVLAPETRAPVAEEFLDPAKVLVSTPDAGSVVVHLPKRLVEIARIFDEIAIEPQNRPSEGRVTSGAYTVKTYARGQFLQLERNPRYWKQDASGAALPYLPTIRLDLIANPEQEQLRFLRGRYQVLNEIAPEYFNQLSAARPDAAHDLGASLNTEQLWFNESPQSPLPAYEKQWFQTTAFRVAVSSAIRRSDLARLAYAGHATPAYGFISPANHDWYDPRFDAPHENLQTAMALLAGAGFHRSGSGALLDAGDHPVRFSILTNAGNEQRKKMATLIQADLHALGIEVTVVTLDFPALIERLAHTQEYEACILGLSNVDPDPNAMMNVWLSSSPNHQWNPSEKTPATPWEAAIDDAMRVQASTAAQAERLRAVRKVQQILSTEQPFIYLVYPNALYAVSPNLAGVQLSVLAPGAVWNIDSWHLVGGGR